MKISNILQGNAQTSVGLLRILGVLGALIGIASHFFTWYTIQNTPKNITGTGAEGLGFIGMAILVGYMGLLLLDSSYAILLALMFTLYMLEQTIGLHLLRYMPFATTKLSVFIYAYLPFSAILVLLGSFASILNKFKG